MNATAFFTLIALILSGIFFFFKPMEIKELEHKEIAQLELTNFTLYELTENGLKTTLSGLKGERFSDRYESEQISFTDTSKEYTQNMTADYGVYHENVVYLSGNVHYGREDGLEFTSDEASYRQDDATIRTEGSFSISRDSDHFSGRKLLYDSKKEHISAEDIRSSYTITDKKE